MEMCHMIFHAVFHFHNHGIRAQTGALLPCLVGPVVIGPTQAEREVGLAARQHLIERPLQQLLARAEPIMIIAEAFHPCFTRQFCLLLTHLGQSQVVKTQVGRYTWLVVATKQRARLYHIVPFRESLPPPFVVFGDGMILWQIQGYDPWLNSIVAHLRLFLLSMLQR